MNPYNEFAKLFKERENAPDYSPIFGTVEELPDFKIRVSPKIILEADDVKCLFDIYETAVVDETTVYVNEGKEVALLPYSEYQKFIALGVVV